jgi:hypothetical protein
MLNTTAMLNSAIAPFAMISVACTDHERGSGRIGELPPSQSL